MAAAVGRKLAGLHPGRLTARWRGMSRADRLEGGAVAVVVLVALVLRTYDLTTLPVGLHGDEGVAGLEAQRILDEGSIGPYSPAAAGQPTGPLYLFAAAQKVLGHSILAVRVVPALMGTATVLLLYGVVRSTLDRRVALASAAVLAVMGWHIHYARIGFPLEAWPFVVLLAAWALVRAVGSGDWRWWVATAVAGGAGIYVYNAQAVFLGAMALFVVGFLIANRYRPLTDDLLHVTLCGSVLLLVALPMIRYAADANHDYSYHFQRDSITHTAEWQAAPRPSDKVEILVRRYFVTWKRLTYEPRIDYVDATGVVKVVPLVLALTAAAGVGLALVRRRTAIVWLGALVLVVMPLGTAITVDALPRRTFAMAPFVAMFAGIALVEGARIAARYGRRARVGAAGAAGVLLALIAEQGVVPYFTTFRDDATARWVFVGDFTAASQFMADLPPESYVYLVSDRHSITYETRQYLAPDVLGEDRSLEHTGRLNLEADLLRGDPAFVLIGRYRALLPELEGRYPGGEVTYGGDAADPAFIAYTFPARLFLPVESR